jgi:hypothetical protein
MTWAFLERDRRTLRLVGYARHDPHATLALVDDALADATAAILDVHFFSGVHTALSFEIARAHLPELAARLAHAGVELDEASLAALDDATVRGDELVDGTLAITLAHGDPDERHVVPAVPG